MKIEELVDDWFKDYDLETLANFIRSFVYSNPTKKDDNTTSKLIDKFLKDQDIVQVYLNYIFDKNNPDKNFRRSSWSDRELIQDIHVSLLSTYYRKSLIESSEVLKVKRNLKFAKSTAIDLLECLNRNETYFYSEKEDSELLSKLYKL
jgi:hypothetical protein